MQTATVMQQDNANLGFLKFQFLTADRVKRAILRHNAKFRDDRSSRCRDMAIYRFLCKMATIRHLGFILRTFGPPAKST